MCIYIYGIISYSVLKNRDLFVIIFTLMKSSCVYSITAHITKYIYIRNIISIWMVLIKYM